MMLNRLPARAQVRIRTRARAWFRTDGSLLFRFADADFTRNTPSTVYAQQREVGRFPLRARRDFRSPSQLRSAGRNGWWPRPGTPISVNVRGSLADPVTPTCRAAGSTGHQSPLEGNPEPVEAADLGQPPPRSFQHPPVSSFEPSWQVANCDQIRRLGLDNFCTAHGALQNRVHARTTPGGTSRRQLCRQGPRPGTLAA